MNNLILRQSKKAMIYIALLFLFFNPVDAIGEPRDWCLAMIDKLPTVSNDGRVALLNSIYDDIVQIAMTRDYIDDKNVEVKAGAKIPIKKVVELLLDGIVQYRHISGNVSDRAVRETAVREIQKLTQEDRMTYIAWLASSNELWEKVINACASMTRGKTICELRLLNGSSIAQLDIQLPTNRTMVPKVFKATGKGIDNINKILTGKTLSIANVNSFQFPITDARHASVELEISDGNKPDPDLRCLANLAGSPSEELLPITDRPLSYSDLIAKINHKETFSVVIQNVDLGRFIAAKRDYQNIIFKDSEQASRREVHGAFQQFTFHGLGSRKFTLRINGQYASCRHDSTRLAAIATDEQTWEILKLSAPDPSNASIVSFLSDLGKYIGIDVADHNAVHCNMEPGFNTRFRIFRILRPRM